jgi:tetratricopeptide (TPR) repeat protein
VTIRGLSGCVAGAVAIAPIVAGTGCGPGAPSPTNGAPGTEDAIAETADALLDRYREEAPPPSPDWPGVGNWTDRRAAAASREAALLARVDAGGPAVAAALGRLYTEVGEYGRGLRFLARALAEVPDDTESWVQLGNNRLGSGFPEEALVLYGRALELNRDMTPAWAGSAEAWLILGDEAAARSHFEETLERSPRHLDARLGLARVLESAGDLDGARAQLERALEVDDTHPTALFRLARVLDALGLAGEARAVRVRHERAAILEDLRLREAGLSAARKASLLGEHYLADGRLEDALRELRSALEGARDDETRVAALAGLLRCARAGAAVLDADALRAELARLDPDHELLGDG